MTYLPAWLLGGERAMTLWAGTQGLALGGVVYVFARRWLSVEWALLLVLLVATTPAVVYGGTSGQVEVKNALFVTAAAFAAARSMGGSGWRWALLAGLLAGLFMGSKYLGLFFVAAVGLAVLPQRRWFAAGAACGLAAMAVGAPWYVWNFVHTGDPVFPMLFHSLGLPDGPYWNAAHDAVFRANFSGDELAVPSSPWWALAYPFVATFDPYPVFEGGRTGLGPWAAMALGPALVGIWAARGRIRRSPLAIVVLVAALFYLLWFLIPSSQRIRHILPIWPIAALALTVAARRGADAIARRGGRPLALALAAVAGFQIAVMGLFGAQFVRYLVGGETRESYLIRTVDRYPLVPYLETLLGPGDKVAMPYRQLQFYMDFPHLHIPPYLQTRVEMLAGPPLTGAAWAERFARLGVTHVVVDDLQTDAPPEGEPFNRMGWAVQHSGRFARVGTLEVPAVASRTLGAAGWSLVMHVIRRWSKPGPQFVLGVCSKSPYTAPMCGLCGATRLDPDALTEAVSRLAHRGPDGNGIWRDETSGAMLGHTRLAVIDLSPGGAQPMASPCGRWVLSYNGELYNYKALRTELAAAGESFSSDSDTEVLLRMLMRHGVEALPKLVGMFAFALWDREEKSLLLARDRLGIKPLVYAGLPGGQLAFASEIDALLAVPGISTEIDGPALSAYLACLYVPAPRSIFRGVRKLAPGHWLKWQDGGIEIERWWQPDYAGDRAPSLDEAVEEIMPLVRQAVVDRLVSDVPVGCFLSGGIDSSVIAALMAEEAAAQGAPPINTFTMTFDEALYDERDAAQAVAAHIGSRHTELPASSVLVDGLDRMIRRFGEPFGNPTALLISDLSRKAREHVTVALVGDGGDEVFGGYPRYDGGLLAERYRAGVPAVLREKLIAPLAGLIPESQSGRHSLRRAREFLTGANLPPARMYAAWVEYFSPQERQALMGLDDPPQSPVAALYGRHRRRPALDAMQQTDLESFLPYNLLAYGDAMSMDHALELRLPLIDHRLVEAVGRLSPALRLAEGKKTLLKGVARRLLPPEIVDRPKRGFNPPMGVWLKTDLKRMVAERLTPDTLAPLGIDYAPVAKLIEEQRSGRRDHSLKVWALLVLEAWGRGHKERLAR